MTEGYDSSFQRIRAELHYHIMQSFVTRGYAPTVAELAVALDTTPDDVRTALRALEEYHGVVLQPANQEIWAAHPFSAAPTNFWVEAEHVSCWANCAILDRRNAFLDQPRNIS